MFNKKLSALALGLTAMALASCGGGNNGGGSKEPTFDLKDGESITYWCPETDTAFFAAKVAEFKKAHPEFKGDITLLENVGEGEVKAALTKDPETSADVFEIADDNIPDCVTGRAMTTFGNASSDNGKALIERYGADAVSAVTLKGQIYGVPYRNDNGYVLSYDKSIVSDEDAKTVEGIIAACKKAGATFNFDLTNSWYTFAPVWAAGGRTYTDDNGVFHSEIATQSIANVVYDFAKIVKDAGTTWNHAADDAKFGDTTTPLGAVVLWNHSEAQKAKLGDRLGIAELPSFTSGGKSYALKTFQGYKALGMRRATAFTAGKKITAEAFAMYMGSDAVAEARLKELSQGVSNKTVAAKTELWTSEWIAKLSAMSSKGNTVAQANGSSGSFWNPAGALGAAIKGGTIESAAAMLENLTICQTAQNAVAE